MRRWVDCTRDVHLYNICTKALYAAPLYHLDWRLFPTDVPFSDAFNAKRHPSCYSLVLLESSYFLQLKLHLPTILHSPHPALVPSPVPAPTSYPSRIVSFASTSPTQNVSPPSQKESYSSARASARNPAPRSDCRGSSRSSTLLLSET